MRLLTLSGLPMALMFGPIVVVIIAYRFKWQLSVPKHTLTFIQLTLGTSVGLMFNQAHLGSADNLVLLLIIPRYLFSHSICCPVSYGFIVILVGQKKRLC